MKYVSPAYQEQLHQLAETICIPHRFGSVAVAPAIQLVLPLPETARVYDFPVPTGDSAA